MTDPRHIEIRVDDPADEGKRVDIFLTERLGLSSRSQARQRISSLSVNGAAARLGRRLRIGDVLRLVCADPPASVLVAQEIPLEIIFENADLIVLDKPQGMVVHPGSGNRQGTLVNALLFHCSGLADRFGIENTRPGIVHRLDKDTSGIIVAAKNARSHEFLSAQFKDRSVRKRYLAIVKGSLSAPSGRIETRLGRDPRNRQRFKSVRTGGKVAVTRYRVLKTIALGAKGGAERGGAPRAPAYSLVLCTPRTGRTHQLRVHMLYAGTPVLGDGLYGGRDPRFPEATLMLHARSLTLRIPGEETPRTFSAPLPRRFRDILGRIQSFSPREGL